MREGWQRSKVGQICDVIAGQSPAGKNYNDCGEGLPFYQGKKNFGPKYIARPKTWTSQITKEAVAGDILMSVRAPVGPINFSTERICIGRGLAAIRPKGEVDRDFLFYGLLQKQPEISGNEGAVFASINKKQIEDIEFPLPPLPEQKRIVAILDEAFEGIEQAVKNAEKNLANARELFESYLNSIFTQKGEGWVEKKLSRVMDITHGFAFKGPDFKASANEKKPIVLTPGNYAEDGNLYFTEKNTKRFTGDLPKAYLFDFGDLTVVMTDLSSKMKILGKPAFVDRPNLLHNQRIGRVIFKERDVFPRFVYYFLRTSMVSEKIKKTSTGTMVRHTAPKRILDLSIPIPSTQTEQENIVSALDELSSETKRLEAIYQQKLSALTELKQSLLQKAFAGELTAEPEIVLKEEAVA